MLQGFVEHFTYLGILALLLLGGLGAPIPEEMPIVAAGILSHQGIARWWIALPICLVGILVGDLALYTIGRRWGERVLNWRVVRRVLTRKRELALKAAYRRHAVKTVIMMRHITGIRAAAFLTAGIAHVPWRTFLLADAGAALVGVPLEFGLAYLFTSQIEGILADVHQVQRWLGLGALFMVTIAVLVGLWRRYRPILHHVGLDRVRGRMRRRATDHAVKAFGTRPYERAKPGERHAKSNHGQSEY
jgi:membrane protein DedA with SNARE-associated domain